MPFLRGVLRVLCVATVLSSAAAALPEDAWARPLDSSSQHDKAATKSATLSSLLDLPYIRSKFINALPEWLHHRQASELPRAPPRDAATRELHFFTTEDTPMQVSVLDSDVEGGQVYEFSVDAAGVTHTESPFVEISANDDDGTLRVSVAHNLRSSESETKVDSAGKNFSMIAVETNVTLVSFLFHPPRDADMSGATAKLENARLIVRMPKRHEKADSAAGTRRLLIERS